MNDWKQQIKDLASEVEAYEAKPTKTSSKRIRLMLGQLKKDVASIRQALVDADKVGY